MADFRLNTTFNYCILDIITSNNNLSFITPIVSIQRPVIEFFIFDSLVYNILKYSRSIQVLSRIDDNVIQHLNKQIKWKPLCDIGNYLAHTYYDILLYHLYSNIYNSFMPFMESLPNIQLPENLTFPENLPEILKINFDPNLLVKIKFADADPCIRQTTPINSGALPCQPPAEKNQPNDPKTEPAKPSADPGARPPRPLRP
ncbi:MAG: hypothetical protein LBW85_02630 [Deltaproteobacteria bacterium]|jgi:hypothetical protein|nr:hypothetical protein [Deltaproteobacteria bacterium]